MPTDAPASHPDVAVILVDDHDLFRAGLRNLLESAGTRVVGDSRCVSGVEQLARRTRATVAVIDGQSGRDAPTAPLIRELAAASPPCPSVVFARDARDLVVYETIRAGARAFLTKDAPVDDLRRAIDLVHDGGAWLQPDVTPIVLDFLSTGLVPMPRSSEMSMREVEVIQLLARGMDNALIGVELGISAKTVKNHVSNIYTKLGLTNRVEAAAYAIRSGIA